jgi:hypothetical protein
MSNNTEKLELLLTLSIDQLIDKIRSGECDAATINVARALLKDNGIQARGGKGSPIGNLANSLPTFADEDGEQPSH